MTRCTAPGKVVSITKRFTWVYIRILPEVIAHSTLTALPNRTLGHSQGAACLRPPSVAKAPQQVQRAFDKQSLLLLQNFHHPSLRAKNYDESLGL